MENKHQNQRNLIKKILLSGKTINTFDCFDKYKITRLSARIFELRKTMEIKDRWAYIGEKIKYKIYYIDNE